ncbi:MAG: hypothetical protein ABNH00_03475, partial [Dokdonia sp.]
MEEEYLIKKWLANDLSADEKTAFEALEHARFYNELIGAAQEFTASQKAQVPVFASFEQRLPLKSATANKLQVVRWFTAAAAVVLIL